jgi:hypothetical protein
MAINALRPKQYPTSKSSLSGLFAGKKTDNGLNCHAYRLRASSVLPNRREDFPPPTKHLMHLPAMAVAHRPRKTSVNSFIVDQLSKPAFACSAREQMGSLLSWRVRLHTTTKQTDGDSKFQCELACTCVRCRRCGRGKLPPSRALVSAGVLRRQLCSGIPYMPASF